MLNSLIRDSPLSNTNDIYIYIFESEEREYREKRENTRFT